jgi:hypothetical protein
VITARHRHVALLVAGCYFMEMLDNPIVARFTGCQRRRLSCGDR